MSKNGFNSNTEETSPHDAAAFWHARIMSGEMQADEKHAFDAWLAESPAHKQAFAALDDALRAADESADALLASEFEAELEALVEDDAHPRMWVAAIAATLMMFVAAVVYFDAMPSQKQHFATQIGETDEIRLSDGSLIEMNTGTSIEVEIKRTKRAVNLTDGQAVFMVEKDRERPFIVATKQAEISVIGTMFDVNVFEGKSTISVVSGVVEVTPKGGERVTLLAGDAVVVDDNGSKAQVTRFDPNLALAWRTGKLKFDGAPLAEVVRQLNRYYETPISLQGAGLSGLPVTGEFDVNDQESAVRALSLIFSLDSREEPARIILSGEAE